ncbi:hypothetical protein ANTPLA_LOCUS10768 [Anthophora plagiata]
MENAVEVPNSNQEIQISVTEINHLCYISPFDPEDPETWFLKLEEQFALHSISNNATKFWLVITKLNVMQAEKMRNIIDNPPKKNMYLLLKRELLQHSFKTTCQRGRKHVERGGVTSSPFPMETVAQNAVSDIFRSIEALRQKIVELRQIIKEVLQSRHGSASSVRQNTTTDENSTPVKVQNQDAVCWYHQKFGKRSTRCIQPCEFPMPKENDCS